MSWNLIKINDFRQPLDNPPISKDLRVALDKYFASGIFKEYHDRKVKEIHSYKFSRTSFQLNSTDFPYIREVLFFVQVNLLLEPSLFSCAFFCIPMSIIGDYTYREISEFIQGGFLNNIDYVIQEPYYCQKIDPLRFDPKEIFVKCALTKIGYLEGDSFYYLNPDFNTAHPIILQERIINGTPHFRYIYTDHGREYKFVRFDHKRTIRFPLKEPNSWNPFNSIGNYFKSYFTYSNQFNCFDFTPNPSVASNQTQDRFNDIPNPRNTDLSNHRQIPQHVYV